MSFSTDLGGICLGRRGTQLRVSEKEVQRLHTKRYYTLLYMSAISGASSKANSLSTILGMPSGFVQRYCTDTLALIICLTIMVTFLLIATFLTRLSGTSL